MQSRYNRQIVLAEIGEKGQASLKNSKVLVIGAGGLGSPSLLYLVAAGVGYIGIVDGDSVEESNLQRQVLYRTRQTGIRKTEAAKDALSDLNPEVTLRTYSSFLDAKLATEIFPEYDLILDGCDNTETRHLINDAAIKFQKPVIFASVTAWDGQILIKEKQSGPCYRCLFPSSRPRELGNCETDGILGSVAGMVALTQTTLALQWLLNESGSHFFPSLKPGTLMQLDALRMEWIRHQVKPHPGCPVCNRDRNQIELKDPEFCRNQSSEAPLLLNSSEFEMLRHQCTLIDVRDEQERTAFPGPASSIHLPVRLASSTQRLSQLNQERPFLFFCATGKRALISARYAISLGAKAYYIEFTPKN